MTDEDVDSLQSEVDALAEELQTIQARFEDYQDRLAAFEAEYRRLIAGRLAKVEALQAELAAVRGHRDTEAEARAAEAGRVATQQTPQERWKSLLTRVMPRSLDDEDYDERERLSKLINEAWERRDMQRLDELEAEVDRLVAKGADEDERVDILRRARRRFLETLAAVESKMSALESTALWKLFDRSEEARAAGRNLLREQAEELDKVAANLEEQISRATRDENDGSEPVG